MGLQAFDPELQHALDCELERQQEFMELIASENYVSTSVLAALGTSLTNKYADGVPGKRMYSGCEFVDIAETLAIDRACELFSANFANVQPYSGSQANAAVYHALLDPGDKLLAMAPDQGGHVTHGGAVSFSGREYQAVHYGVDLNTGDVDYTAVAALAEEHEPKLIVAGFSAYSGIMDWQRFRDIADAAGAYLMIDMAHVAGLVAAGLYPNPIPVADVVTTTTHKTLRGPRGGMILASDADRFGDRLNAGVYPGIQGGPLMHVIAAKAVAFLEALAPEFRIYQQHVLANAKQMADVCAERGLSVWSGGTDNHMLLLDLGAGDVDAQLAERVLEQAHIAVSCMAIPGKDRGRSAGLRLGTAAVTTRGLMEPETEILAHAIADLVEAGDSKSAIAAVRGQVNELCERFPVYPSA